MATGARVTIAEVDEIVEPGALDPECVVTPGVFVDRVVRCERPLDIAGDPRAAQVVGTAVRPRGARAPDGTDAASRPT